jgi:S1-C subfamily serine protease
VVWVLLAFAVILAPAFSQDALDETQRTNGAEIMKAVAPAQAKIMASRVLLGESHDKILLTGIILSDDGYLLTKWTEISSVKKPKAWLPDGSEAEARVVKHNDRMDLALLKIDRGGLSGAEWAEQPMTWKMGEWLCAPVHDSAELRLGVMSARRRAIPNSGAVMGVRFEPSEKGDKGVTIEEVAHSGPADQAGLKAGDMVIQVKGETVNHTSAVRRVLSKCRPGDVVKVRFLRKGKEDEKEVQLGSASQVMMNWSGGDFANHGTSLRTDNFPDVIQHALLMTPQDMGGAIFDLKGRAIGINIARVDRVTNYALPEEAFLPEMKKWMDEDRVGKAK